MEPGSNFIVLTCQRTGSTWLVDMLDSHPEIAAYSELLLGGGRGRPTWGGGRDVSFWETYRRQARSAGVSLAPGELLERYLAGVFAHRPGIRSVGFKVMYEQMGNAGFQAYLSRHEIRIVHLVRNGLDVVVSRVAAERSDVYHRRGAAAVANPVTLDPGALIDQLRNHDRAVASARDRWTGGRWPFLEVAYESLCGRGEAFAPLLRFLGVDEHAKLSSGLVRIQAQRRRDRIANWDEVAETLEGTPYRHLLVA